ncbi:MAG TPA: DUF86 domain-containing protein [Longimicrobium sp.]|jgi:uncharacterized protein with HEPN domain|nr:DUF86 domain-containing protein [Longimicrobium sp.]
MSHPDHTWLADILIAARHVARFVAGVSRAELEVDVMRQSAVIRQLEIIGEASKQISAEFRSLHPEIPWRAMAGMRDVLIHGYRHVNPDAVWSAATESVPALIQNVEPLVPPFDE